MNFKTAMTSVLTDNDPARLKKLQASGNMKRPLLWKALENIARYRYEANTGNKIGAGFDWSTILPWLVENLPMIIKLITMIFGL